MSIKETGEIIAKNWQLLIVVIAVLFPVIWGIASVYYSGRIESLREQVNLMRIQHSFLIEKLKSIENIKNNNSIENHIATEQVKKIEALIFPSITNPQELTKEDIRKLAEFYDLTKNWKYNPHLKMKDGDISYWYEQGLTEDELKIEFESRRIVLEQAEENKQVIDSQGDLSLLAQKIQTQLIKDNILK